MSNSLCPLVSIIIPCYNQAQFLDETLQSVLSQTFESWECIIINDGSPDNTEKIAQNWIDADSRFKYYYQENKGLSAARNTGLEKYSGKFIQFLDSDDLLEKNKLEIQVKELLGDKQISLSDYFPFNNLTADLERQRYLTPKLAVDDFTKQMIQDWEYRVSFPPHCVLFKADLLSINKLKFNENLKNHEDWVFWVKLFYFSGGFIYNEKKLVRYRIHSASMTSNFFIMKEGFLKATEILEDFFVIQQEPELVRAVLKKRKEILNHNKESLLVKYIKRGCRRSLKYLRNGK